MEHLPPWLTTALISAGTAGLTWLLSRRLYRANVAEKEATGMHTMTIVAAELAKQLKTVQAEIPEWRRKVSIETQRADDAERRHVHTEIIQSQARIIIENVPHLYYAKDPDEPESPIEKRFKAIKGAAEKIAACVEEK